jgi:uncharacterized protein (TIGR00255 family)
MNSMTGYAEGRFQFASRSLFVSFKGLNNRYLEVNFRGTGGTAGVEKLIRDLIKERIFRGKIDITCDIFEQDPQRWNVQLNDVLLAEILDKIMLFKRKYKDQINLNMDGLLKIPMVFHIDTVTEAYSAADIASLQEAVTGVFEQFLQHRASEGRQTMHDVVQSLDVFDGHLAAIGPLSAADEAQQIEAYRVKIAKLINGLVVDEKRIALEAAILAEKYCINEEIVRLKTHSQRLRELCSDATVNTKGKEADFLTQEMLRETHTIAAKTASDAIHQAILRIRREIEKIRQQVQNIE